MAFNFINLDDFSSNFTYTSGWTLAGITPQEYDGTLHGARSPGAQVTIVFTGLSIEVYGTIGQNAGATFGAVSSYTINGNPSSTRMFTAVPGSLVQYRQLFYSSQRLAEKEHTLVITYTSPNKDPLWLDYVRIGRLAHDQPTPQISPQHTLQPTSQPTSQLASHPISPLTSQPTSFETSLPASPPHSRSSSKPASLSSSLSTSQLPSQPTSLNTSQVSSQSPGLSKGAIAGIAIGSFAAICLAASMIILWHRLSRRLEGLASAAALNRSSWDIAPPGYYSPFDPNAVPLRFQDTDPSVIHQLREPGAPSSGPRAEVAYPSGYTTQGGTFADKAVPYPY
ncbi:hypothetical protein FPV67DRAFT_216854 [Lyophyllum atratum]|nr:hypothetical protein FPV67DRAFT_216854 [Lyophyllum atratum]